MNNFFICSMLFLGFCATGCQQNTQHSDNAQDTVFYPNLVKVHITGKVDLPDSTGVHLKSDRNELQSLLIGQVLDGEFVLIGELDEPNFYNLTVQGEVFKVYLENGKQYEFVGEVDGQGKLQTGRIQADSEVMGDYDRFMETMEAKHGELTTQSANIRSGMGNPDTYQQNVEQSIAIGEQRKELPGQVKAHFLKDEEVTPQFKLYLIKEEKTSKANYDNHYAILNKMPDSLKGTMLYREAELRVKNVRDFYENMPDFPLIRPRNLDGDSLMVDDFRDNEALLFVFWGSWNDEARNDIQEIKKKSAALQALGVAPIYLTWEKNYDSWEKASKQLGLGKHNYRLNPMDKDFVTSNYGVNRLPHYLLVDANDLSVINERFTYPLDGLLENQLKKELAGE